MSPLKKLFSALPLSGFLAFACAIALASNHTSLFEFIVVFVVFFLPLAVTFIFYKKQTAKPKI